MNKYDKERYDFYNEILAVCLLSYQNTSVIFAIRPELSRYNIFNVLERLVRDGYMLKGYNGNHACFKSIKRFMPVSDYVPYQPNMIEKFKKSETSHTDKQAMSKNPNLRIIRPENTLKHKHVETSRLMRAERKSPAVNIGCSFAMF